MENENPKPDSPSEIGDYLLVVVGAHLRAEVADRPLAYDLSKDISHWLAQHDELLNVDLVPVVCSDIWYVNQEPLQQRPTISLGGPGVNALTAYWWQQNKIKPAFIRDEQLVVQLDPEFIDLRVAIWGVNHELTVEALDIFRKRYLDSYLRAVATQVEPEVD